ncbi:pimeloyl-ACP methyl ester carboxylesterase [Collimonas sp. PA-H2]|nr:pimeloyl-ACP methyl ester carboxylesterase [Collimonas sp. PA-H2]
MNTSLHSTLFKQRATSQIPRKQGPLKQFVGSLCRAEYCGLVPCLVALPCSAAQVENPSKHHVDGAFQPDAFWQTFHHAEITVNGIKIHYVDGGTGAPILLIPGWPQSWYAWRFIMPALAASGRRVIAIDPRGMGDSSHPLEGYDLKTVANDVHQFVEALGLAHDGQLYVAGHDVGAWIAYAYAADWSADVKRLVVLEAALPGITPPAPAGVPSDNANTRTWHFGFNRLDDLPEILVQGHERAYLSWIFQQKATRNWVFTPDVIDEYVRVFIQPGGPRAAFSYYRVAFSDSGLKQNRLRAQTKLTMPVLAVGGQFGVADLLTNTMKIVANDVTGKQINNCGHFVLEECPKEVTEVLQDFFRNR